MVGERFARFAVSIDHSERGGALTIRYRILDQFDDVVRRLAGKG